MPRRISLSPARNRQRQLINQYNQSVNQYNQKVRDVKRAVDKYNSDVRSYNSRLRTHQQRVQTELGRLQGQHSAQYSSFRTSVTRLHTVHTILEGSVRDEPLTPRDSLLLDMSEGEDANSLGVLNALLEPGSVTEDYETPALGQTSIGNELALISQDFDSRWRGALYSLSPENPDAARHFCASAREIFTGVLDLKAPDFEVESLIPDCQKTQQGTPTRRAKIQFLLQQSELTTVDIGEFVDEDIQNILELFDVLNSATHGEAGLYDWSTLVTIKRRVEDGLIFLARIAE